jgi:hypothetical protein
MLGGYAMARTPRAALPVALVYVITAGTSTYASARFFARRGERARQLVGGVARAAQLNPFKVIVLADVDPELFFCAGQDNPFRLVGAEKVYLAPGSEQRIPALPGIGDPAQWSLPPDAARRALNNGSVAVYSAARPRLRNITGTYISPVGAGLPRRVDAANPLTEYLLGEGWYALSGNHRWMAKRATLRLGGPRFATSRLHLFVIAPQPVEVAVSVDEFPLPGRAAPRGEANLEFPLPAQLAGRGEVKVAVEVARTVRPSTDPRDLGLAFGVFEIR